MRKLTLFMHCSLDGFVSGPHGELDWITLAPGLFDMALERTNVSDTAFYGRVTYEMMQNYWPEAGNKPDASKHDKEHSAWYNRVSKVVLSKTLNDTGLKNTRVIRDNLKDEIIKLKQQCGKDIVIFGSPSASHALMKEGLIDDYWLFVNPVILSCGIPLFKGFTEKTTFKLRDSKVIEPGVVCLHYQNDQRQVSDTKDKNV